MVLGLLILCLGFQAVGLFLKDRYEVGRAARREQRERLPFIVSKINVQGIEELMLDSVYLRVDSREF